MERGVALPVRAFAGATLLGALLVACSVHARPAVDAPPHVTVLTGEAVPHTALPAPPVPEILETGPGTERSSMRPSSRPPLEEAHPTRLRPRSPRGPHRPSGAGLLGLFAAPANAPPRT